MFQARRESYFSNSKKYNEMGERVGGPVPFIKT
jgi:hypothetical protein